MRVASIEILHADEDIRCDDDNFDVVVKLEDGRMFGATFFTVTNVSSLMGKWRASGEYGGGMYFWASYPIIVEQISYETVSKVVAAMIADPIFEHAFEEFPVDQSGGS